MHNMQTGTRAALKFFSYTCTATHTRTHTAHSASAHIAVNAQIVEELFSISPHERNSVL